ncbi:MAG: energy transducer TonB [Pseudomonadota bacterium]|uniref:energy transducer TonB n=1 Tax=Sphingomonas sp. ERG5 TaxID=1381597 RepID=UPI00054BA4BB|nr:energy transducer TonB [Sphingomonas sp. ERG5]
MKGSFHLGLPAICSLAVNGLLLLGLLQLGIGQQRARKEAAALTVMSLAVPLGAEDAQDDQQAEQEQPQPAAPVPPPVPLPNAKAILPAPPLPVTPPALSVVAAHAAAQPAAVSEPAPAASVASADAAASTAPPPRKGAADSFDSSAPAGNSRSYAARIRSWLYAHKTYPRRSRMRREEGVVRVRFTLDRQGQLLEGRVIERSGFPALDEEGQAMLSRASPYPAAPQEVPGTRIEFTVPLEWRLPT